MQNSLFRKNVIDISPEIQSLAEKEELGELYKVYPVSKRYTAIWVGGQICLFLGGLWILVIAAIIFFSPLPKSLIPSWAVALPGFILLIAGCYMTFSRRIYAHWRVSLWQDGFLYEKGQVRQVFRWDQIENLHGSIVHVHNGPAAFIYICNVQHQNGYEVKLGVFSEISELIDIILEKSVRQFAPQELRIASPKSVKTFTTLILDRQGISNEQETLSWQEIQEFITKNGIVTLRKKEE